MIQRFNGLNYSKIYSMATKGYNFFSSVMPSGHALPPLHIYFLVSDNCNLKCEMCHWLKGKIKNPNKNSSQLTLPEIKNIIKQIPGKALLTFAGGEPFIRQDFMDILEAGASRLKCHVITNGTLLTEEKAEKIIALSTKNIFSAGVLMVGFSLQGNNIVEDKIANVSGTYTKIIDSISMLQKKKSESNKKYPQIHVTTVITDKNVNILSELYSLSTSLGVEYHNFVLQSNADQIFVREKKGKSLLYEIPTPINSISINLLKKQLTEIRERSKKSKVLVRFSPPGIDEEEMLRYYRNKIDLNQYCCGSLWTKMAISPYGDVYSCYRNFGNLRENRLNELWNSREYRNLRNEIKNKGLPPGCAGCCFREYK